MSTRPSAAKLSEAICRKGAYSVVEPGTSARSNLDRFTGFCEFFSERGIEHKLKLFTPPATNEGAASELLASPVNKMIFVCSMGQQTMNY